MATTVSIAGSTRQLQSLTLSQVQNGVDRAAGTVYLAPGDAIPAIDNVLLIVDDGDTIFGGTIKVPTLGTLSGLANANRSCQFSALDYNEIADRRVLTLTIPSGSTLQAAANLLLPYLSGVSLDTWTGTGPTFTANISYEDVTAKQALDDLSSRSGWLYNIGPTKKLMFFDPAIATAAPWDVNDGDGNTLGDITVQYDRINYANQLIVRFTSAARAAYDFLVLTGQPQNNETVVIGGKTYTFVLVLSDIDGWVLIGADYDASLRNLAAAIMLDTGAGTTYAASTTRHTTVSASWFSPGQLYVYATTAGAAGNSIALSETITNGAWASDPTLTLRFGSDAALTSRVQVDDAAEQALYGIYSMIVEATNVYTEESAEELAAAILASAKVVQRTIHYTTRRSGLLPGMSQTIVCSSRGLNDSCLITEVVHRWTGGGGRVERNVTAVAGATYKGSKWRDQYRQWSGTGQSSLSVSGGGGGGGGTSMNSRVYYLGMSRGRFIPPAATTWTEISGIPWVATESFTGRVRAWVRERTGATVSIRLAESSDGITYASLAALSDVSSATLTERTATVNITAGKYYRLEVYVAAANLDVEALGYVESLG